MMKKRIVALLMALLMALQVVPAVLAEDAFAAKEAPVETVLAEQAAPAAEEEAKLETSVFASDEMEGGKYAAVSFLAEDDEGSLAVAANALFVKVGELLGELPAAPEKENAVFLGWQNGDVLVDAETVVSGNMQLVAAYADTHPAAVFTGSANGIDVVVNAPRNAFPAGTTMTVVGVSENVVRETMEDFFREVFTTVTAVDITFYNAEGEEIEPLKEVDVQLYYAANPETDTKIAHIDSAGETEHIADLVDGCAEFSTDAFSIYVVGDVAPVVRGTLAAAALRAIPTGSQDSIIQGHETVSASADNNWQVVSGGYKGYVSPKDSVTTSGDGMVRTHKSVVPTNVENEFLVYLSMDTMTKQVTTYEYISQFVGDLNLYWNFTAGSGAAYDEGNLGGAGGGSPKHVQSGSQQVHITWTYKGDVIADKSIYIQVPNSAFYLDVGGGHYICIASITNQQAHATSNYTLVNGVYEVTVHLTEDAYNALFNAMGHEETETAVIGTGSGSGGATVTDTMGPHIVYDGVYSGLIDGSAAASGNGFTWTLSPKASPLTGEADENHQYYEDPNHPDRVTKTETTYWNYNVAEMVYKVHLNVMDDGFASGADYNVNTNATLNYSYKKGDITEARTVGFTVPQVQGTLYDFDATKVDGSNAALAGATFTLTGPTDNPDVDPLTIPEITTGADGKLSFSDMPWGTYTLEETDPPFGYAKPADLTLQIGYTSWPTKVEHNDTANDIYKYADNWQIVNTKNTVTVHKYIKVQGDLSKDDIEHTIYYALRRNEESLPKEYLYKDGQLVYQTLTINGSNAAMDENNHPEYGYYVADVTFEGVPSGKWDVMELAAVSPIDSNLIGATIAGKNYVVSAIAGYDQSDEGTGNNADLRTATSAEVWFTNTYKHADGRIDFVASKEWQKSNADKIDPPAGATVTFTLYRTTVNSTAPEEVMSVTLDGTPVATAPTGTDPVGYESGEWVATFKNLPTQDTSGYAYTYKVKETAHPDGFLPYNQDKPMTAEYNNEYLTLSGGTINNRKQTTDVVVKKTVVGPDADKNVNFAFTATLDAGSFGATQDTGVTVSGGTATFSLKDSESVTLRDVPVGASLTIAETVDAAVYSTTVALTTGTTTSQASTANTTTFTVADDQSVEFTNTRNKGYLRVTKVVTGDIPYGVGNKEFSFTVTGPSYPDGTAVKVTNVGTVDGVTSGYTNLGQVYVGDYTAVETLTSAAFPGYTLRQKTADEVTGTASVTASTTAGSPATATITNTYTQDKQDLTFTKVWVDNNDEFDLRYTMEDFRGVLLLKDGVHSGSAVFDPTQLVIEKAAEDNTWTITFKDMPDYVDGQQATYTLTETGIAGYTPRGIPASVGGTITNTLQTQEIEVKKVWDDNNNQDGKRGTVTLNLIGTGTKGTTADATIVNKTFEVAADATTLTTTLQVPVKDSAGNDIVYTLTENGETLIAGDEEGVELFLITGDSESDYTATLETTPASEDDGFVSYTVTNTHTPKKVNLVLIKTWNDAVDTTMRPDIDAFAGLITVTADPTTTIPTPGKVADGNTYTLTWSGLPKYSAGTKIAYSLAEGDIKSGDIELYQKGEITQTTEGGYEYTVTNTRITGKLTVSKTVVSTTTADHTKPFTFTLTLNSEDVNGTIGGVNFVKGVGTFTLTDGDTKEITGLPVGLTYTVEESATDAAGFAVTTTGDVSGTIVKDGTSAAFTNMKNEGGLTVTKAVDSAMPVDKASTTKYTITVTLSDTTINGTYGGATFTNGSATLRLADKESVTITGLPENVTYTVAETAPENFTASIDTATGAIEANKTKTATVTNTRNTVNVKLVKIVSGNMGDRSKAFTFTVTVTDPNGGQVLTWTGDLKHGDGGHLFENLPVGATVTITETAVKDYTTTIAADGVEGTEGENLSYTFTVPSEACTVNYTNKYDVTVDTGINTETKPYFLLLALIPLAGAALVIGARRRRRAEV